MSVRLVERHFEVLNGYPPELCRVEVYHGLDWSLKVVSLVELGVWDRAQGMPHLWCVGNVVDTAREYRRARRRWGPYHKKIQEQLKAAPDVVLDTIIAVDGRTKRGREGCRRTRWNIDDGCMRAVARAVKGYRAINAYLGRLA